MRIVPPRSRQDVADLVDFAVEEFVEAEDDVPEVNGAHQRDVEHAVVGHGVGQLLDTAAVVLAHTERDTEQQVVVDPFAVDPIPSCPWVCSGRRSG